MLKNKNCIGINIMGHDASLSYYDGENIFAIDEERLTRFKHDGTSISKSLESLFQYRNIDKENVNFSLCYEDEKFFSNPKFVLKKEIEKNIRKVFKLTEIKQQKELLESGKFNFILKLFQNFHFLFLFYQMSFILFKKFQKNISKHNNKLFKK